ncbi:hypothetical protein FUAX_18170 [Fulvitalea axinellae]|uniref:RagB/SusD family nutrient uptake outer membrane protein n=1 Tax=Fulvitalea axinellae TaxID=1182444 RepID=A0AAU9DEM1_9BACT|nr:hypothetical protein FUAX_18170 [Fulvitalea axinellae]
MKKIFLYICLALMALCSACNEEFLERYPLDEISPNDYWKSTEDMKLYCNQFYGAFPVHSGWWNFSVLWDNNSDNLVPGTFNNRLAGRDEVPTSGGGWNWDNIRKVNYMLANTASVEGTVADVNHFMGEARFFRAWFYFEKVKAFGDVPWISKPLNIDSEELYAKRDARNVVVDSIIMDLDKAIAGLKEKGKAPAFRINKEVAMAFKSRVCLFEGTWEKYHTGTPFGVNGSDGSKYLQLAAEVAGQLIDGGKFSLYSTGDPAMDYHNVFNKTDYSGVSEVMLWKKYDRELGVTHNLGNRIPHQGMDTGLSKALVDSYLCSDGLPIAISPLYNGANDQKSLVSISANRDPRFSQVTLIPGNKILGEGDIIIPFEKPRLADTQENRCTTGYQIFKGASLDPDERSGANQATVGTVIFRFAEVLLNYAEAKAETGNLTQGDLDKSINKLRDRVGMPHLSLGAVPNDPNKAFSALSALINEIRRERRVETALDGTRLSDLLRWRAHELIVGKRPKGFLYKDSDLQGTYTSDGQDRIIIGENLFLDENGYIDPYQKSLPAGYGFNPDRDYLRPIPTQELTLNPQLSQNPGWE